MDERPENFISQYLWEGKEITDIKQWCRDRKEKMVRLHWTKRVPNFFTGEIMTKEWDNEMPETFWNCLTMSADSGLPVETGRYDP